MSQWREQDYCHTMLPLVSRTFAACIGLLPRRLEFPVLVAYLLCRIADTIEDSPAHDAATKSALLDRWRQALDDDQMDVAAIITTFAQPQDDDQALAAAADRVLTAFRSLDAGDQAAIRPWVGEMCEGMAWFSSAYPAARPGVLQALDSEADLDRYCYFVAGTVGHLLTALFARHAHRISPARHRMLRQLATSFGLGLQLTNIIKDVADDHQRGWCFVPAQLCQRWGLAPADLLDPGAAPAARQVMQRLIATAEEHLRRALRYCRHLPHSQIRIRLFCLTPLYFAIRTLRLAEHDPRLLDPGHKVKITRREVRRTILISWLVAPSNRLITLYFRHLAHRRRGLRHTTMINDSAAQT